MESVNICDPGIALQSDGSGMLDLAPWGPFTSGLIETMSTWEEAYDELIGASSKLFIWGIIVNGLIGEEVQYDFR